jgi:hypothetical protein
MGWQPVPQQRGLLPAEEATQPAQDLDQALGVVVASRDVEAQLGTTTAHAANVTEVQRTCTQEKIDPTAIPALAVDWIDGLGVDELRQRHGDALGATDPMKFAKVLDRIVVQNLAWVLSAIVLLIEHRLDEAVDGPISAAAAMAKYGVNTVAACYAASVGIRHRPDAMTIGSLFPTNPGSSFARFLEWVSTLSPADITGYCDAGYGEAALRACCGPGDARRRARTHGDRDRNTHGPHPRHQPRQWRRSDARTAERRALSLVREYDNPADPNAIAVTGQDGTRLGYAAREAARILAPLIDLEDGPSVAATLAVRPTGADEDTGHQLRATMQGQDVVWMRVTVAPR